MKKVVALLLVTLLAFPLVSFAFAEEAEETESQFEQVLLRKGTLIVKEYTSVGSLPEAKDEFMGATLQAACVTDVETGFKYYAARIEHYNFNDKYDSGPSVGILDFDEIDGAITTFQYVKDHYNELKNYSEVVYSASTGLQLGGYTSEDGGMIFIKLSSRDTMYYPLSSVDEIIDCLRKVKEVYNK